MKTPICTFLEKYALDDNIRLHMPGHKGEGDLIEKYDLTEIPGADSLYEASGIIKESEENASRLFGCETLFSTEGSSLAIRAMLYLASLSENGSRTPLILAGRNAHKVFISGACLIGFEVEWLLGEGDSYLSSKLSAEDVARKIDSMDRTPTAVYITSPDYLGNVADVEGIASVCHERGIMLLVDNAHGAYLAFTEPSMHPIHLGADMCADSAHKTLPSLTGGAYLHLSSSIPAEIRERAKAALSLFGSTSPSYLILASLDKVNAYLDGGYREKLLKFISRLDGIKERLGKAGYVFIGNEPMKLTIASKLYGYAGSELAEILMKNGIVPEFSDPDHLVLMPTPETKDEELEMLVHVLSKIERREKISSVPPTLTLPNKIMTPREAIMLPSELIKTDSAEGRILADVTVACPPAVPIVISGEKIDSDNLAAFRYYGIEYCRVIK